MKQLIRIQYLLAILFLVIGVSFWLSYKAHYWSVPPLNTNQEFVRRVNSIQDIEHLRKMLFTVTIGTDKALVASDEVIDAAVSVGVAFCLMAAAALWGCASQGTKIFKANIQTDDHAL